MSILTDKTILKEIEKGTIKIEPFNRDNLGTNSYDLTLGNKLKVLRMTGKPIDPREPQQWDEIDIPETGYVLQPWRMYLGFCNEYTETLAHVPMLADKSSVARLAASSHFNAGFGDVGFKGYWTIELKTTYSTIVYPNMPICQLYYHTITEKPLVSYDKKASAKYSNQGKAPQESKYNENFKK